jgi:phosphoserine phosphatase
MPAAAETSTLLNPARLNLADIRCVVFDFGRTLSSDHFFTIVPAGYPQWTEVIQEHIFRQESVVIPWMMGDLELVDIAKIVSQHIDLPLPILVDTMERGCTQMRLNPVVWNFACAQHAQGRKTALVTANMDVFTRIVVPLLHLDTVFDVIFNTADHHELRKEVLWDRAFELLGDGIGYANSLLIEDGPKEPALFREQGGVAYQYENDDFFRQWLEQIGWQS